MRSDTDERRTYTIAEARRLLGVGRNQTYLAASRGEIPGVIKIGKRLLISNAALDRMLAGEAA